MAIIHAIIINFHQEALTERAVASVFASALGSTGTSSGLEPCFDLLIEPRVVLIDNESDGVWVRARYGADDRVELIVNEKNIGFGAACNQGIECALARGADGVLFLNNDALLEPDALRLLVEAAAPGGLAAPKITLADGRLYAAGGLVELTRARARNRGIYEADRGQYDTPGPAPFASACALLATRAVLMCGIRFYEPYFLYYEDADFCLQARRAGFAIAYAPQARVTHLESASTARSESPRLVYYNTRNRLLFLARHGRPVEKLIGFPYAFAVTLLHALRDALTADRRPHARAAWRGLRDFLSRRFGPMGS